MYPRFAPEPADEFKFSDADLDAMNHVDAEVYLALGRHLSDQEAAVIAHLVGEDLIEVNGYYDAYAIVCTICEVFGLDPDSFNQDTVEAADETLKELTNKYATEKM